MRDAFGQDDELELETGIKPSKYELHASAAAFYVALLRGKHFDEAQEFQEWYLETFDHDLED